ncbi:relaxase/mobilization nuclease domain-containing protein [Brevundimonas sp.]|uniref:relaxase/mobilization nuclease domain-containing protein n=1 Tax=Brevundimonas sp. TaxID=1871086 RepID=UPI003B0055C4
MSGFRTLRGFEEALRPPIDVRRARLTPAVLSSPRSGGAGEAAARFARVARRTPEVMVKITGRTRDGAHLRAHLDYISRNGSLSLEGADGEFLSGRSEVQGLAKDWAEEAAMEPGRRRDRPVSLSVVLSMPAGTEAWRVQDAARAFASEIFGERFAYVFVLHDEGRHPHVHLTVRTLGRDGERLNPRKADLQVWREHFARALRDRAVEAEATPRRARGVTRKAEQGAVRRMRERFAVGRGPLPRVLDAAYRDALEGDIGRRQPWREALRDREAKIRKLLVAESLRLKSSTRSEERLLGAIVERFVRSRADPQTREDALRRRSAELRERGGVDRDR